MDSQCLTSAHKTDIKRTVGKKREQTGTTRGNVKKGRHDENTDNPVSPLTFTYYY